MSAHICWSWTWKCSRSAVCVWHLGFGSCLVTLSLHAWCQRSDPPVLVLTDPNRTVPSGSFLSPRAVFVPRHVFLFIVTHQSFSFIFNDDCSLCDKDYTTFGWKHFLTNMTLRFSHTMTHVVLSNQRHLVFSSIYLCPFPLRFILFCPNFKSPHYCFIIQFPSSPPLTVILCFSFDVLLSRLLPGYS